MNISMDNFEAGMDKELIRFVGDTCKYSLLLLKGYYNLWNWNLQVRTTQEFRRNYNCFFFFISVQIWSDNNAATLDRINYEDPEKRNT